MSFLPSVIEKLQLTFLPTWNKTTGDNSTEAKIKVKNINGDIAGRDINKTYITPNKKDQDPPYVFIAGAFGGNGHSMHFQVIKVKNLSDEIIFLDKIYLLGITVNQNNKLIEPKSTSNIPALSLDYPTSNKKQYLEFEYHTRNDKKFVAKQELLFSSRVADDKYDVSLNTDVKIVPKDNL